MQLRPGQRLRSAVCATEVIVIRAPEGDVDLRCGGSPVGELEGGVPPAGAPGSGHDTGTLLGKRYADEALGLEVLCTKAGTGSLAVGDDPLPSKEARPLPSSD